jgi:metal-responsive CopG/Arc/MetJ family transcriptional regulator
MVTKIIEKTRNWKAVTISIPENVLQQFDKLRGDVSRSRYIKRLIQEHLDLMNMHMAYST